MDRIRSAVETELSQLGPGAALVGVVEAWPVVVGEAIAAKAWPARIARDGTLHVYTADSVWAFELQQRALEIAKRLGVEAVRFVPGPIPEAAADADAEPPAPAAEPTERDRLQAAELTEGIENAELREAVARAAAASLARTASGRSVW